MSIIASEEQAERIGAAATNGTLGEDFTVFTYELRPSRITAFGVKLKDGQLITHSIARGAK